MPKTNPEEQPSMSHLLRGERGASFIEYIIVVGLVAIIAIAAFGRFGQTAVRKINDEERALNGLQPSP
jgi:Flp pilus assembly pilin Flp